MINIEALYSIIGTPLGYIMWLFYMLVNNFGVAIIIFTLIIKAALFPFALKQQKNMAKSALFMPKVKEIQAKYKNKPEKQQEEMAKLQKQGYNPMGGCGSMLITMLLLFGVIDVVYKPMTHMEHFDWTQAGASAKIVEIAKETEFTGIILSHPEDKKILDSYDEATILISDKNAQVTYPEGFEPTKIEENGISQADREAYGNKVLTYYDTLVADTSRLSADAKTMLKQVSTKYTSLQRELYSLQTYSEYPKAFDGSALSDEVRDKLDNLQNNMSFLGLDLGKNPTLNEFNELLIIPIFAFILSLIQMIISQKIQKLTNPDMAAMGGGTKAILYIMPFFSLYISFVVPAGVGFYWGVSYLFGIAQSIILYKCFPPEKLRADAKAVMEANSQKFTTTGVVIETDEEGNTQERVEKMADMSQKELREYNRRKLEEARRADAEKYGEEYDGPDENN